MKKRIMMLWIMVVMAIGSITTFAETWPIRVVVNTEEVFFPDGAAYVDKNSRILVPVRFVSEQLGASVEWNIEKQMVTVKDEEKVVTLIVGKKEITVNGVKQQLDTHAVAKQNRVYVPVRFVSEALGATVKWDTKGRTAYISNGRPPRPQVKGFRAGDFTVLMEGKARGSLTDSGEVFTMDTEKNLAIYGSVVIDPHSKHIITLMPGHLNDTPYSEQCEEAAKILRQQLSEKAVNEIMSYAKKKTGRYDQLEMKKIYDGKYEIRVFSTTDVTDICVHYK